MPATESTAKVQVYNHMICGGASRNLVQHTQRVRSRSEDRRARPGGGSRSSGAPTMAAGSLSVAADGPPEAIRSVDDVTAATKRRTTSRLTVRGAHIGISGRFPHSSNYFR